MSDSPNPFDEDGLAPVVRKLPTRLNQVLIALFDGKSEKEVAARLRISPHTVHEYTRRLHRLLHVNSRGELLARCAPYLPTLRAPRNIDT